MRLPYTIDLNIIGLCNLDCPWCWGPEHTKAIETLTINDWKTIIKEIYKRGARSIVFTGGEPLLKNGIDELLSFSKSLGIRVTLSTNGILLLDKLELLKFVDDIGIPLDGSDKYKFEIMRKGVSKKFDSIINVIKLINDSYKNLDFTIRTVVTSKNKDDIENIGNLLLNLGIDTNRVRWKIYQCNTGGPRMSNIINGNWLISDNEFDKLSKRIKERFKSFKRLTFHTVKKSYNYRYLHILPNGKVKIISSDKNGLAIEKIIGEINPKDISNSIEKISIYINSNVPNLINNFLHHG